MKFLRRAFFIALLFSSGLLVSCVSTDSRQPGNVKFPINPDFAFNTQVKDIWVAQVQRNSDRGDILNELETVVVVSGTVLSGVSRAGNRVVLEFDNRQGDEGAVFRSELSAENMVIAQERGLWFYLNNNLCLVLKGDGDGSLDCYRVYKFGTMYVFEDLENQQQYRLRIVGPFNEKDNLRRFGPAIPKEDDTRSDTEKVGYAVGYSEVCNNFFGSGASPEILNYYKQTFGHMPEYKKGYSQWNGFSGADYVYGLDKCDEVKKVLVEVYKNNQNQ